VIHRIAINNRVSLAVAKHIYECRSIKWKQQACQQELRRQENAAKGFASDVGSPVTPEAKP
jgi:hypothetical protein